MALVASNNVWQISLRYIENIRVSVIPGITPSRQPSHQTAHTGSACKHITMNSIRYTPPQADILRDRGSSLNLMRGSAFVRPLVLFSFALTNTGRTCPLETTVCTEWKRRSMSFNFRRPSFAQKLLLWLSWNIVVGVRPGQKPISQRRFLGKGFVWFLQRGPCIRPQRLIM